MCGFTLAVLLILMMEWIQASLNMKHINHHSVYFDCVYIESTF